VPHPQLASFTTLFEMKLDSWLAHSAVNFAANLERPADALGVISYLRRLSFLSCSVLVRSSDPWVANLLQAPIPLPPHGQGYVLGIPDEPAAADKAIVSSLTAAVQRGLGWLYPSPACKHGTGPHQGSCTYASLPAYWDSLVAAIEKLNAE
jgi:hypothetical protein